MAKAKKEKKQPEPYWQDMIAVWFNFCKEKYNDIPTFDNSAPRDLKNIIQALRKRAEDKGVEWTQEVAIMRFRHFLEHCWMDRWLSDNWLLMNIARQKDKIFFSITRQYLSR
jgi:hypothetical protein